MTNNEFEAFVLQNGKDILRFCKMIAKNDDIGCELYQDTMLLLLKKLKKLDREQNIKSYALSCAIFIFKSHKRNYSVRNKIAPNTSLEEFIENGGRLSVYENSAEQLVIEKNECEFVRKAVSELNDKYKIPLYLQYSAGLSITEIAKCLKIPQNTVKTRIHRAKQMLKQKLEATENDR